MRIRKLQCAAAALAASYFICALTVAADDRPNIVFFLSDDQRFDAMGCAGHAIIKTPTMDKLAEQGTRFKNAFVTTSICAASRASIFTGLFERTHRYTFREPPLAKKFIDNSYPKLLRRAGYRTGFVGKFGVGVQRGAREEMFDFFKPLGRGGYFKKQPDGSLRHTTQIAADRAIDFLKSQDNKQPFCLSISYNAPHAEDGDKKNHFPWPKAVDGLYDDVTVPAARLSDPAIYKSQPDFLKKSLNRQRYFWRWDTPEKYQKNIKAYFRMISGVDHSMGRVLDQLNELGMATNTVVIFMGDNGYYRANRGFAGKWSHYEDSLRVPMIVMDPRVEKSAKGLIAEQMALNIDIPRTMLAYAGVKVPDSYQGVSLKGLVGGDEPKTWRTDFFCEHLMRLSGGIPKWEGVRDQSWVYARYFEQKPVYEFLHDLKNDPDQLENFATASEHKEVLEKMRARCDALRNSYGGPYKRRQVGR
jgi:arylsulfatase A-like enzyme